MPLTARTASKECILTLKSPVCAATVAMPCCHNRLTGSSSDTSRGLLGSENDRKDSSYSETAPELVCDCSIVESSQDDPFSVCSAMFSVPTNREPFQCQLLTFYTYCRLHNQMAVRFFVQSHQLNRIIIMQVFVPVCFVQIAYQ